MMIYKFLVPKNLFLSFFFFFFFFLASSFISFRRLNLSNYYTHTHPILSERQLYTFISIYLYVCVCAALSLIIAVAHTANGHNITRMFFSIALLFFFFLSCVSTTTYFRFMAHNFLLLFVDCCQLPSMCVNRLDTGGGGGAKIFRLETKNKQTLRLMIMPPSSL